MLVATASLLRRGEWPQIEFCGGDYTGVVPPVPISNTEVKYTKADDSVMNAKVGSHHLRTQLKNTSIYRLKCFLL